MDDTLRTQCLLLLDILIRYRVEHPDVQLSTIMDNNEVKEFSDEQKLYSSLTLLYEISKSNYEKWTEEWATDGDLPEHIGKGLKDTKEVIDKIQSFKDTFTEFQESNLVLQLLDGIDDEAPFKTVIDQMKLDAEGSAMGRLVGGNLTNQTYTPTLLKTASDSGAYKSNLTNVEHLHNLVGGSIEHNILKIALKNNNNNVYHSLASLTDAKTLSIYKMLAQ